MKPSFEEYMSFNQSRKGDFIITKHGLAVWPLDPSPAEVDIRDIAFALSHQTRYAGHAGLYTVAMHSLLISQLASPENALWGLLHDADEAYLPDMLGPVKRFMPEYKLAGKEMMQAICKRFGLPLEEPAEIKELDQRIVANEMGELLPDFPFEFNFRYPVLPGVKIQKFSNYSSYLVFLTFLDRFSWLTTGIGKDLQFKYPNPRYTSEQDLLEQKLYNL